MMKRFQIVLNMIVVFAMILLLGFPEQSSAADRMKLIVGWEPWAPFLYKDSNNTLTGLDIEIITNALSNSGYVVEYKEAPWVRILKWIEEGKIHIGTSATKTPEREAYAYFSAPYQKESYILFVRKGESSKYKLKSLQDIIGSFFRLGVTRNSLCGAEFDRLMKDPAFSQHVEEVTTDEQNHKKLLARRIDGFIEEYSRLSIGGRKSGIVEQVESLFVIDEIYLHMIFSKKAATPEIISVFNAGLEKIRGDGTYQKIFEKYNLEKSNMLEKQ